MDTTKTCTGCRETKPVSDFWKTKNNKDGLQGRCKPCHKTQVASYYDRITHRNRQLWLRYKVTPERYEQMLVSQGGKCAVCGSTRASSKKPDMWNVDHDHSCCPGDKTCGKCVRGLLCAGCNTRLGMLESESGRAWFKNMRNYLERFGSEIPEGWY